MASEPHTRIVHPIKVQEVLITEVIVEDFMSYEYARIPLTPGLNIICGPNGSGKSSILLAISVALGQAYTERSRRLSDLIRRGKDRARVSLLFDNRPKGRKRPISISQSDVFMLSRYIRKDGSYWYEADYKEISKNEVNELFDRFGLNPDNLLIIMHQGMIEEFTVISPQERLRIVEEAVGFRRYRENILEAQAKLLGLIHEEETLTKVFDEAGQTMGYWKDVYDRFMARKELVEKISLLGRELAWGRAIRQEESVGLLRDRIEGKERALEDTEFRLEKNGQQLKETEDRIESLHTEARRLYFTIARLEREGGEARGSVKVLDEMAKVLEEIRKWATAKEMESTLRLTADAVYKRMSEEKRKERDIQGELGPIQSEIGKTEKRVQSLTERWTGYRVMEALLSVRKKDLGDEIRELNRRLGEEEEALRQAQEEARKVGERIETKRGIMEIQEELSVRRVQLDAFKDVPDDAERIYMDYSASYEDLKGRLKSVVENKEVGLREVEERKRIWKEVVQGFIEEINPIYEGYLAAVGASGTVRLVNYDDIQAAGLQILVGFRGSAPEVLDAYTQSGGERSVAVVTFLLALQQRVLSPLRALDEFDLHMDPRNREVVFSMILSHFKNRHDIQQIVITPSQLTVLDSAVHVITVQKSGVQSGVREVI